jgi:hypothetical protein
MAIAALHTLTEHFTFCKDIIIIFVISLSISIKCSVVEFPEYNYPTEMPPE